MKFKFHKFKFNQFKWKGTGIAFHVLLIAAAFLITAAAVVTGAYVETGYQVSVGVISPQRFKATRKVENTLATEQNRAEAEKAALDMKPLRKKDPTINEKAAARLEALFISLDDIRRLYTNERLEEELEDGVPPPGFAPVTESGAPLMPLTALEQLDTLQLTLSETQSRLLLEMDAEHYDKIKETIPLVLETVFDQGVQEVDAKSLLNMQDEFAKIDMNGDMQNMGYQIASSYLEPNYIVDEAATAKARQEIAGQYQQVFLLKDQMIVDKDEPIDEEAYQILEALGFISYGLRDKIVPAVNAVAVLGILYALSILYLITYHKNMFAHKKE
ncbi:MAG: hypothetical protein LBT44_04885, partial [Clostridiales bacterium]|nr:hypothetical protein [Clostridiales bacterium]